MKENTSRRTRKKNKTHKSIMHNAKKLFEQKGIGNVTIEEISESADVSRSTFFTHFTSLDDLYQQIANEEIEDLVAVWENSEEEFSMTALLNKLVEDTFPYPYLTGELLMNGILSRENYSFKRIYELAEDHIKKMESYQKLRDNFTAEELSAIIIGSYFGFLIQKFIKKESFNSDIEMKNSINKFIKYFKS